MKPFRTLTEARTWQACKHAGPVSVLVTLGNGSGVTSLVVLPACS